MSDDPRVTAVSQSRASHQPLTAGWPGGWKCSACDWVDRAIFWLDHLDEVAVAALDAYDEGHRPEASDISAASWANLLRILDAREVRRREIIASEIDHARDERDAALSANDAGRYEDGFVDGLDHAASIARGRS